MRSCLKAERPSLGFQLQFGRFDQPQGVGVWGRATTAAHIFRHTSFHAPAPAIGITRSSLLKSFQPKPSPGQNRTSRTGSGFGLWSLGVETTWFSRARLARVLDDSANQKSGRPSAGGDIAGLGPTSRVADLAVVGPPAPRNAHPPSFMGACRHSPAGGPFRNEEAWHGNRRRPRTNR
jgi:hypothetical protein